MIRARRSRGGGDLERLLRDGVRPALSDSRLLERYLLDRDEPAFEELVERHGPMVLSLCRRCLRDPRDVEDAFQATFLVLVRKGSSLRDAGALSSWLYGVAYRVASRARANVLRRRSREGESEAIQEAPAPAAAPFDDSVETLDAELNRLPEKYRAPLVLCYLEGRTHEQAAAELGWPVGTVRSRMARGRALLESRLTRRGLDVSALLALARPDFSPPSLFWTLPPSLVRSTLEGVGRFAGAAGAATVSTPSLPWPATALAQGVLSAMMISQFKWIGLGTAALGVLAAAAGMSAGAVGPRPAVEDGPARAPAAKPEGIESTPRPQPAPGTVEKPSPRGEERPGDDVQARIAEMERKLDRISRFVDGFLNARFPEDPPRRLDEGAPLPPTSPPAADIPPPAAPEAPSPVEPSSPGQAPQPSPVPLIPDVAPVMPQSPARSRTTDALAALVLAPSDGTSVREIEAILQNLHRRQRRNDALRESGMISEDEAVVPTELARVLVARLREMEDEFDSEERSLGAMQDLLQRVIKQREMLEKARETDVNGRRREDVQKDIERLSERIFRLDDEMVAKKLDSSHAERRRGAVQRLIQWAESHFKDLRLEK